MKIPFFKKLSSLLKILGKPKNHNPLDFKLKPTNLISLIRISA